MTTQQQLQQTKIPTDWDVDVIDYWNASLSSYKKHHEDPENQVTAETVTTEFLDSLPVKQATKIDIETKPVEEITKPPVAGINKPPVKRKAKAVAVEAAVTQESRIGEWTFVNKEEEEEEVVEEQEEEEQVIDRVEAEEEEEEEEEGYDQEEYIGEPMPKKARYQHQQQQQQQQAPMPTLPVMPEDNEGLSNLIMAWYYAGYYTGLYQANQRQ